MFGPIKLRVKGDSKIFEVVYNFYKLAINNNIRVSNIPLLGEDHYFSFAGAKTKTTFPCPCFHYFCILRQILSDWVSISEMSAQILTKEISVFLFDLPVHVWVIHFFTYD